LVQGRSAVGSFAPVHRRVGNDGLVTSTLRCDQRSWLRPPHGRGDQVTRSVPTDVCNSRFMFQDGHPAMSRSTPRRIPTRHGSGWFTPTHSLRRARQRVSERVRLRPCRAYLCCLVTRRAPSADQCPPTIGPLVTPRMWRTTGQTRRPRPPPRARMNAPASVWPEAAFTPSALPPKPDVPVWI